MIVIQDQCFKMTSQVFSQIVELLVTIANYLYRSEPSSEREVNTQIPEKASEKLRVWNNQDDCEIPNDPLTL